MACFYPILPLTFQTKQAVQVIAVGKYPPSLAAKPPMEPFPFHWAEQKRYPFGS